MRKSKYIDYKVIKRHARELRNNLTDSETQLWKYLRNRQLSGYKFLRQHPILYNADYKGTNYFIADFYCKEKETVIELDGPIHEQNVEYDQFRDNEMKVKGINVLRIKNEELENIENILEKIKIYLSLLP
jgi:very-short-patch-repair endonuclease